jgi:YfiH family protein
MSPSLACRRHHNRLFFPILDDPHIFHGVFTRQGGVSSGPWASLNVASGVGDKTEHVQKNRQRIKDALGISRLVSTKQVHGAEIYVIEESVPADLEVEGYDALVTNIPEIGLMIQHADCQAVLLYDPVQKAVGIIHAGWRGSVADIIGTAVSVMIKTYATDPANVLAAISPSLGPCCAEFINYQKELPPSFWNLQIRPFYFDFWRLSHRQLCRAGLRQGHISSAGQCTVCNHDYFSFRRDGITGRCGSVIGLRA